MKASMFLLMVLLVVSTANAFPQNRWRGNCLYWQEDFSKGELLQKLSDLGYNKYIYPSGELKLDKQNRVTKSVYTWSTEESEWEKRFSSNHFLEFEVSDTLLLALEQRNRLYSEELFILLEKELDYYQGKFKGITLKISGSRFPKNFDLHDLRNRMSQSGYKLGVNLSANSLHYQSDFFDRPPHFIMFSLVDDMVDELSLFTSKAVKLNIPFFFTFDMQNSWEDEYGQSYVFESNFVKEAPLSLIEENRDGKYLKRLMKFKEDFQWGKLRFAKNSELVEQVKTFPEMRKFVNKTAALKPFWYSGHALALGTWKGRVLLKDKLQLEEPHVVYNVKPRTNGLELELSISNPNPIAVNGRENAGIGLMAKGFKLKGIKMGEFDRVEVKSNRDGDYLYFFCEELKAYQQVGKLVLELESQNSELELKTIGWLKPKTEVDTYYYPSQVSNRVPHFQIKHNSKTILKQ